MTRTLTLSIALVMVAAPLVHEPASAQGRRGGGQARPPVVAFRGPMIYTPFLYDPFLFDPWYPYRYGFYPPFAYAPFDQWSSSLRLQVTPREAEVFIDGYIAGTVDDFDGVFQRLNLAPGEHELTLYLEGHRTVTQRILVQPRATFRVRHTMVPLGPGETADPRPSPPSAPRQEGRP